MANNAQLGVKGLSDEDLALLKKIEDARGMSHADVVSAGLRLLEASYAEADDPADPSPEDCRAVEKALRVASETACDVIRGYAARAAADVQGARSEAEGAVAAARKAADGLAAELRRRTRRSRAWTRSSATPGRAGTRCATGAPPSLPSSRRLGRTSPPRAAKEDAERGLLASVDAERLAVAQAASLREHAARLEGRLEALGQAAGARDAAEPEGEVA